MEWPAEDRPAEPASDTASGAATQLGAEGARGAAWGASGAAPPTGPLGGEVTNDTAGWTGVPAAGVGPRATEGAAAGATAGANAAGVGALGAGAGAGGLWIMVAAVAAAVGFWTTVSAMAAGEAGAAGGWTMVAATAAEGAAGGWTIVAATAAAEGGLGGGLGRGGRGLRSPGPREGQGAGTEQHRLGSALGGPGGGRRRRRRRLEHHHGRARVRGGTGRVLGNHLPGVRAELGSLGVLIRTKRALDKGHGDLRSDVEPADHISSPGRFRPN